MSKDVLGGPSGSGVGDESPRETVTRSAAARRVWSNDPVVIADGEVDTMAGCDIVRRRIGERINELESRLAHIRAKPATSERADFMLGLREELDALVHTRGAIAKRKEILSHVQAQGARSGLYAAVRERFGIDVLRELTERAKEISAASERRKAASLVGSAIPVGAIGGPRRRAEEKP